MPSELADMLMRNAALALTRQKIETQRVENLALLSRLEIKPGFLGSLSPKAKSEREASLRKAQHNKLLYDPQIKEIESLAALLKKEIGRWLDYHFKMTSAEYVGAMAGHAHPEDWARFDYQFELLVKSYLMGLQDLGTLYLRSSPSAPITAAQHEAILKLLPVARLIEIDVEFLNRIYAHRAHLSGRRVEAALLQPEYAWCETTEHLVEQPAGRAHATLKEIIEGGNTHLPAIGRVIKSERTASTQKTMSPFVFPVTTPESFLKTSWEQVEQAAFATVDTGQLEAIIAETEALLLDGAFTVRFNRNMVDTAVRHRPESATQTQAHAPAPSPQSDAELRALKDKLQAELQAVAATRAQLADKEKALKEAEQRFAETCRKERKTLEEAKNALAADEASIHAGKQALKELQTRELAALEDMKAELTARASFIEESEQRLINKGQEQIERAAELDQKEEELAATRRELNALRKEIGIPQESLRATPVDEFNE